MLIDHGSRYFTRKKAQAYGLTGWCRNTDDNKVGAARTHVSKLDANMAKTNRSKEKRKGKIQQ